MEKIIAEQIEKNFSEYKEEMIWILIGFSLLVLIIQFSYNLCLSRKIEKFK
jgi:cell division protein FtsW (lipid II flippase)